MAEKGWGSKLRRVPLLGGVVAVIGMFRDVYEAVGWTDPGYHSIRSSGERLDEARKVAAIGDSQQKERTEGTEGRDGQTVDDATGSEH